MASNGTDDYALDRVPDTGRRAWFGIAVQRFGQISALTQFLVGAMLGFRMEFWNAVLALTLGAIVIELAAILIGIIGVREGLSTTLLARWTGLGTGGAALLSLMLGLAITAGFGVQSGIAAQGLASLFGALPVWAWAVISGLVVTVIVVYGISSLAWTAYLAVPLFLVLVTWSITSELLRHPLSEVIGSLPAGPPMSLIAGATFVAGSFFVGAVITPDMSRFNRSVADVIKQTVVGITLGEYVVGVAGILLALAARTSDVGAIVLSSVGWVGVLVIVLGTVKINDWNLYSGSLAVVNCIETIVGRRVHRATVTVVLGAVGTGAAAAGILGWFVELSSAQGYVFAPVGGIMVAEYFVVKRWRADLDRTRFAATLPDSAPRWVPATIVVWVLSALCGALVPVGIPPVNAFAFAFVSYVVAGKLGLVTAFGGYHRTERLPAEMSSV
ncbi:purine-cytosine permease family protein [Rhodococcus sp. NPDC127530]|uniref:purine-cytosine permease family protein n=1 Tax=unclassified Rhodococcus (in: high G+C Gram-positive bacteria) TaxID=192944 RepID=UPI0036275CBA